jgi:hypothetical protein
MYVCMYWIEIEIAIANEIGRVFQIDSSMRVWSSVAKMVRM